MPVTAEDFDEDQEVAAEQAFHRSETYEFNGQKLGALTFARDAASARLGLRFDTWGDSWYLIYLCLTPEEEVRKLWGEVKMDAWRAKADAEAERLGLHPHSPLANEANEIAARMLEDKWAANFQTAHTREARGQPAPEKK